jgi:hypothetical protein
VFFCNFRKTDQINQSLNGQKIAQSGHPGYKASAVKIYNASSSLVHFENKIVFFYFEKTR